MIQNFFVFIIMLLGDRDIFIRRKDTFFSLSFLSLVFLQSVLFLIFLISSSFKILPVLLFNSPFFKINVKRRFYIYLSVHFFSLSFLSLSLSLFSVCS